MFLIRFYPIQTFVNAEFFYVRNPIDSLLADEGSAGLRSHEVLSDKKSVKTGPNYCDLGITPSSGGSRT